MIMDIAKEIGAVVFILSFTLSWAINRVTHRDSIEI